MKGDPEVIDILGEVLCAELTAVNQYFIHAKMCANWGYHELAEYGRAESIDEMKHAEILIERILFLEGTPNMQKYMKIKVGKDVPEQLRNDLELEYGAVDRLNRGIALCLEKKDNGSRRLLQTILEEEEHHVDWLETQLDLIESIGLERYLQSKLGKDKSEH
jgi:bacterioferritin